MSTLPSIAVIIPTRDRPHDLMRALESIRDQTDRPDEVVVIDDASSPDVSADALGMIEGATIRLLRNERGGGANFARNRGLAVARADYVAFLDDDDIFLPGKIAMLRHSIAKRDADIYFNSAEIVYVNEGVSYFSRARPFDGLTDLLTGNPVGGTSVVCVRREAFLDFGGFDADLPALQDWEAWTRSARNGARFYAINEVLTRYHFTSGKPAISKSIANLEAALGYIERVYAAEFEALSPRARARKMANDHMRYAHRLAMLGRNRDAFLAYARAARVGRDPKILAAALVAPFGIAALARLRALAG